MDKENVLCEHYCPQCRQSWNHVPKITTNRCGNGGTKEWTCPECLNPTQKKKWGLKKMLNGKFVFGPVE